MYAVFHAFHGCERHLRIHLVLACKHSFRFLSETSEDDRSYALLHAGFRTNAQSCDLSDFLTEEVEAEVKEAAEISMGTEIGPEDLENITVLCSEVSCQLGLAARVFYCLWWSILRPLLLSRCCMLGGYFVLAVCGPLLMFAPCDL